MAKDSISHAHTQRIMDMMRNFAAKAGPQCTNCDSMVIRDLDNEVETIPRMLNQPQNRRLHGWAVCQKTKRLSKKVRHTRYCCLMSHC